ncbi:MAG: hypothetical protein HDS51_00670 [Barnesiella sp.]|nr:hypothetical protein [Barnesiella sp.]
METRTYGVMGLTDWQCEIPVGKARATVHFTGGAMTSYGVTPAEYTTSDPVRQKIIEGSRYFKEGRIKLLRKTGEPEPAKEKVKADMTKAAAAETEKSTDKSDEMPADGEATEPAAAAILAEAEPVEVAVSCLTDAQNYLRDNFGIPTSKSRSIEKALALGAENGVKFAGLNDSF